MSNEDWFVPIPMILGWMDRGEAGFKGFSIADLATAIEITELLHLDRFGRLKKATDGQKSEFIEVLADYYESINRVQPCQEIQEAALSGDWEKLQKAAREQLEKQKKEASLPTQSGEFGWMCNSLRQVVAQAKAGTAIADTPAARKAKITQFVNEFVKNGNTKTAAYAAYAKQEGVAPGTIKQIHLRK